MIQIFKKINIQILTLILSAVSANAYALNLKANMCVQLANGLNVEGNIGAEIGIQFEAGGEWDWVIVAEGIGEVRGGSQSAIYNGLNVENSLTVCVDTKHLQDMLQQNKLTQEQERHVRLYLGEKNTIQDSLQAQEVRLGMLTDAALMNLSVRRTSSTFLLRGNSVKSFTTVLTGQTSAFDSLDEMIGLMEGVPDLLPMSPQLNKVLVKTGKQISGQLLDFSNGVDFICGAIAGNNTKEVTAFIEKFCEDIKKAQEFGTNIQTHIQTTLKFAKTLKTQIGPISSVATSLASEIKKSDKDVKKIFNTIDGVTSDLLGSVDTIVSVGNSAQSVMNVVESSVDSALRLAKGALIFVKDQVVTKIKEVVSVIKSTTFAVRGVVSSIFTTINNVTSGITSFIDNI